MGACSGSHACLCSSPNQTPAAKVVFGKVRSEHITAVLTPPLDSLLHREQNPKLFLRSQSLALARHTSSTSSRATLPITHRVSAPQAWCLFLNAKFGHALVLSEEPVLCTEGHGSFTQSGVYFSVRSHVASAYSSAHPNTPGLCCIILLLLLLLLEHLFPCKHSCCSFFMCLLLASCHVTHSLLEQKVCVSRSLACFVLRRSPSPEKGLGPNRAPKIIDDRVNESTSTFPIPFLPSTFSEKHIITLLVWKCV